MERGNAAAAAAGNANAGRWEASADGVIVLPAGSAAPPARPRQPSPPPPQQHRREKLQETRVTGNLADFVFPEPPEKVFYKTKLCDKFMNGGRCLYLEECTFAHGNAELRPPAPLPPGARRSRLVVPHEEDSGSGGAGKQVHYYNSGKVCYEFRDTGRCIYGEKCNFAHSQAVVQPGAEIRYNYKPPEPPRRSATPPVCAFTVGGSGGSFAPPGAGEDEQGGKRKPTRLELLSRKKMSGIYGDWPEGC